VPCEIEIQKRELPQSLKDMRAVYNGEMARTPGQRLMKQIMDSRPEAFLARLEAAEKEWRAGTEEAGAAPVQEDVGGETAGQVAREWLERNANTKEQP